MNAIGEGQVKLNEMSQKETIERGLRDRLEFEKALSELIIAHNVDAKVGFPAGVLARYFTTTVAALAVATYGRDLALQIAESMRKTEPRIIAPDNAPGELIVPAGSQL